MMSNKTDRRAIPQSFMDAMGGKESIQNIVHSFFDLMCTEDRFARLKELHGPSPRASESRLFLYMVSHLSEDKTYQRTYGTPRFRAMHRDVPIDEAGRDQWVACMREAFELHTDHQPAVDRVMQSLEVAAQYIWADPHRHGAPSQGA